MSLRCLLGWHGWQTTSGWELLNVQAHYHSGSGSWGYGHAPDYEATFEMCLQCTGCGKRRKRQRVEWQADVAGPGDLPESWQAFLDRERVRTDHALPPEH